MNRKAKAATAVAVVAMGAWFYFTPHLTFHSMKSSAEASDSAAFNGYIDFPALKENLKGDLNAKLAEEAAKAGGNAMGGAMFAAAFMGPMIDALVTPQSIELLMRGENPTSRKKGSGQSTEQPDDAGVEIEMGYEGFNSFVLNAKQKDDQGEPVGLVLKRDGLFSWKLAAVRLPL